MRLHSLARVPVRWNRLLRRHARACRGHPRLSCGSSASKTWMAGTSPAMTPSKWFNMTGTRCSASSTGRIAERVDRCSNERPGPSSSTARGKKRPTSDLSSFLISATLSQLPPTGRRNSLLAGSLAGSFCGSRVTDTVPAGSGATVSEAWGKKFPSPRGQGWGPFLE